MGLFSSQRARLIPTLIALLGLSACSGGSSDGSSGGITPIPGSPTNINAVPGSPTNINAVVGDGSLTVQWDAVTDANSYNLYFAEESFGDPADIDNYAAYAGGTFLQGIASTSQLVSNLNNGTSYYMAVTAVNSTGESATSAEVSATPQVPVVVTVQLNDTGIDWCADLSTSNLDCPVSGYPGQDGEHGRDAQARAGTLSKVGDGAAGFDYTKLSANGDDLPASATEWSCVRDNHIGLIWEVKTTDGGLRDRNNTYTWYNPDPATNGGSAGVQNGGTCNGSNCDTQAYVQAVNAQGLCGAGDWRMPTVDELLSLTHLGVRRPAIDTGFFPNTFPYFFWSASPYAGHSDGARFVDFGDGNDDFYSGLGIVEISDGKSDDYRVRLVRGGQ